jgi:predicted flap endonuclease-1-like 5' DNA nuclease
MAVITDKKNWELVTQEKNMKKGPLVKIPIGRGQFVKMYEADAIAKGLLPSKAKPQADNKMRLPTVMQNKSTPPEPEEGSEPPTDDFTTIPGVGPATARALVANGITTFEQLRQAGALAYITSRTMQAIEAWRSGKPEDPHSNHAGDRTSINQGALDG